MLGEGGVLGEGGWGGGGVLGGGGRGGGDNWQYCHVCMKSQTCYHQML